MVRRLWQRGQALTGLLLDLARVARVLPGLEQARRWSGPPAALALARKRGSLSPPRLDQRSKQHVELAIRIVDRLLGANCYRRVLLEVALDPANVVRSVHFGLDRDGGPGTGHVWLGSDASSEARYDAVFSL